MVFMHKVWIALWAAIFVCILGLAGLYSYSMKKVKNGLSYFHSQIIRNEGNVESLEIQYGDIDFQLPFGLMTENLSIDIQTSGADQHVRISSESVSSQLKGFPSGAMKMEARNISLRSGQESKPLLSNQFKIRDIEVHFIDYEVYVSILNPDQSMRRACKHLAELLDRGDTTSRLKMQGIIHFQFGKGLILPQRFFTQVNGNLTRIVLNRDDLNFVAPKFADRLSEGDLDLVANHPLKAPRLLEIRKDTEEKSRELRWALKSFPEDVYRHVLWSYLLTKEYGSEFAQVVTNSHELGSYNTEEEIAKDRQNNLVGIAYAVSNVPEGKLLEKIKSDPRIHF
tara:strand:+ start:12816 stop:13832 length:1017 start_codon:yes stop_codon:yes gene_type:complete